MTNPEARFREAVAHQRAGELDAAEAIYRELLAAHPTLLIAHHNLIATLRARADWAGAEQALRRARAVAPHDPDIAYHLGLSLLASGNYAEGWPLYEARRSVDRDRVHAPKLPFREWRGEPVTSLLVWPEQGFGDQIMFARYVPLLKARGIEVTLVCRPGLETLLAPLGVTVIPAEGQAKLPACDAWVLMGSLPLRFGTTLDTIPDGLWLKGRAGRAGRDGEGGGQGTDGQGIGLVTRGRPTHPNDANRSLPKPIEADLFNLPGAVSLHPEDTGAKDFAETAEIVRRLERVITVDTAVAHLAGALGKPVWILLPAAGTDWRWLRGRSDSPWYPSATLFRQPTPGDWWAVVDEVRGRLGA
ncbi:hypothetical protein [Phenylobacterium sp.]|uniref:hypothetical protein n=1 Tax=Phenylobacterium sp. TaxID=1871053 RepID=UPI002FE14C5D